MKYQILNIFVFTLLAVSSALAQNAAKFQPGDEVMLVHGTPGSASGHYLKCVGIIKENGQDIYLLDNPTFIARGFRGHQIRATAQNLYALEPAPTGGANCAQRLVRGCPVRAKGESRELGVVTKVFADSSGKHRMAQILTEGDINNPSAADLTWEMEVDRLERMPLRDTQQLLSEAATN